MHGKNFYEWLQSLDGLKKLLKNDWIFPWNCYTPASLYCKLKLVFTFDSFFDWLLWSFQIKALVDFLDGSTALTFAVISCWNCQNSWRSYSSSRITITTDAEMDLYKNNNAKRLLVLFLLSNYLFLFCVVVVVVVLAVLLFLQFLGNNLKSLRFGSRWIYK